MSLLYICISSFETWSVHLLIYWLDYSGFQVILIELSAYSRTQSEAVVLIFELPLLWRRQAIIDLWQCDRGQRSPRKIPQDDEWKDLFSNLFWVNLPQSSTVCGENIKCQFPGVDIYWDCLTISNLKYIKLRKVYSIVVRILIYKCQIVIVSWGANFSHWFPHQIQVRCGLNNGLVKRNCHWSCPVKKNASTSTTRFLHWYRKIFLYSSNSFFVKSMFLHIPTGPFLRYINILWQHSSY